MSRLKDDNVMIVFLSLVVVVASGEKVSFLVKGAGLVLQYEVVLSQFGDLVCLSSV